MSGRIDARLQELGIEIPEAAAPVANYVAYVITGNLCFTAGQVPLKDGAFQFQGKLGDGMSPDEGYQAARLCAINVVSQLKAACDGDLDRVKRIVKLVGFVNSTGDFTDQPKVVNGASDLMVEVFGDAGKHARSAVSAAALPVGVAVEVECIAEIA